MLHDVSTNVRVCIVPDDVLVRKCVRRKFVPVCTLYPWPGGHALGYYLQMLEYEGIAWQLSTWVVAIVFEDLVEDSLPVGDRGNDMKVSATSVLDDL